MISCLSLGIIDTVWPRTHGLHMPNDQAIVPVQPTLVSILTRFTHSLPPRTQVLKICKGYLSSHYTRDYRELRVYTSSAVADQAARPASRCPKHNRTIQNLPLDAENHSCMNKDDRCGILVINHMPRVAIEVAYSEIMGRKRRHNATDMEYTMRGVLPGASMRVQWRTSGEQGGFTAQRQARCGGLAGGRDRGRR